MTASDSIVLTVFALFLIGFVAYREAAYEQHRNQATGINPVIVILATEGTRQ